MIFLRAILVAAGLVVASTVVLFAVHWFLCELDETIMKGKER